MDGSQLLVKISEQQEEISLSINDIISYSWAASKKFEIIYIINLS